MAFKLQKRFCQRIYICIDYKVFLSDENCLYLKHALRIRGTLVPKTELFKREPP